MITRTAVLAALLLASASPTAFAAAATADGATRLATAFKAYLTDTAGGVTVTPNGDVYDARIDLAPLFAKLPGKDVRVSVSPLAFTLADQGGGKWQVQQKQPVELSLKAPGTADISVKIDEMKRSGLFDESLGAFTTSVVDAKGLAVKEMIAPEGQPATNVAFTVANIHLESASQAEGADAVSGAAHIKYDTLSENFSLPANPGASTPAMNFVLTADGSDADIKFKGMKAKPLAHLLAFLVAHPSQELLIRDQAPLKAALSAALPILTAADVTGTAGNIKVGTMLGDFSILKTSFAINLTGAVKDAKFREAFTLEGLAAPAALIPPWAADLVPTKLTLDFSVAGLDLAAPAALMLDKADFSKTPPLPPELEVELGKLAIPSGVFTVGLGPSALANKLAELKMEGSVTVNPAAGDKAIPPMKADISLAGFEKLMAALQTIPKEMGLQQALPVMMLVKGMAKAGADGALTWHVETAPGGSVLINGVDVSKMGGGK